MSTRGCFGVRVDEVDHLMYNHSDSYLGWLGVELVRQIRTADLKEWKRKARELKGIDDEGAAPTPEEIERLHEIVWPADHGIGGKRYELYRPMQGNLGMMLNTGFYLRANEFMRDSLFCEWAYVVNLDTQKLEIYRGGQHKRHKQGRYATVKASYPKSRSKLTSSYWPVALIAEYDLKTVSEADIRALDAEIASKEETCA